MLLNDRYSTGDFFVTFKQIEDNTRVLMYAYNNAYTKNPSALSKNIHYTVLLPILKLRNNFGEFNQSLLQPHEKRMLNDMLCYSTPIFCLSALILHSKQLTQFVRSGFTEFKEIQQLLELIGKVVVVETKNSNCVSCVTYTDAIKMKGIIEQIHLLHSLF